MTLSTMLACGCAAGAMAMAGAAAAQSSGPDQGASPTGAPPSASAAPAAPSADTSIVGEVIVTAQRRAERLHDVPIAVTAQTGADLTRAGITSVRDLTQVTPGLSFTTNGSFAQPAIRGVSSTLSGAGAESPTAIYVDGVYQPNQPGNVFDLPDVERVEVLKGPQGTLFGRNATAGAIAIHTREPGSVPTGAFTVDDGVYVGEGAHTSNAVTLKGFYSTPITDKLAVSLAGYYQKTDGFLTDLRTGDGTGAIQNYLVRGKVKWTPVEGMRFLFTGSYTRRDDDEGATVVALNGNSSAAFYPGAIVPTKPWEAASELKDSVSGVRAQQKSLSLRSEFDIGQAGTLTLLSAYSEVNETQTSDIDGSYAPSCLAVFGCLLYNLRYPTTTFQQEVSFASQKFGRFSFVAGGFAYHDVAKAFSNINPPLNSDGQVIGTTPGPVYLTGKVTTTAAAAFGEANIDITDRLRLIAGLRYSWEERAGEGQVSLALPSYDYPAKAPIYHATTPRVSALYKVSSELNVYLTYSEGFKSGVLDVTGRSAAQPEDLKSIEGGVKYGSGRFNLNLSGFHYDYTNLQVQFFNGSAVILANAKDAEIYGFDGDATVRLPHGFEVRLAGSWVPKADYLNFPGATAFALPNTAFGMPRQVIDASGDRLLKSPEYTGAFSVAYTTHLANGGLLEANANVYASSSYDWDLLERVQTKAYATVNGTVGYTPPNSKLRFGIYVRNLTNEKYISGTVLAANADAVVYAPPRQVGVNASYAF